MRAGRRKKPSLSEVAYALRPGMSKQGAQSIIDALARRGDLVQREVWEHRGFQLTPQGLKRARRRALLVERQQKEKNRKRRVA